MFIIILPTAIYLETVIDLLLSSVTEVNIDLLWSCAVNFFFLAEG